MIEVGSGSVANLTKHCIVWERLKSADLILYTGINEIDNGSAFGHWNEGRVLIAFANTVWLDNRKASLLDHNRTNEDDVTRVYLLSENAFNLVVNLLLGRWLAKEVHYYSVIVAGYRVKVYVVFVLELLAHYVSEIRTLGVDYKALFGYYLL